MICLRSSSFLVGRTIQTPYKRTCSFNTFCVPIRCQSPSAEQSLRQLGYEAVPCGLDAFQNVLEIQGYSSIQATKRKGLLPLVLPLAENKDEMVVGFIIWPQPAQQSTMSIPVVCMRRGDLRVKLLAKSVDDYLKRQFVSCKFNQSIPGSNLNRILQVLPQYEMQVDTDSSQSVTKQLVKHAGLFLDVAEELVAQHLARQDTMSALITCDWYMKKGGFIGWGRPQEFSAITLNNNDRQEEARDLARMALKKPWWTLQSESIRDLQQLAQMTGTAQQIYDILDQLERGRDERYRDERPIQEILQDRAFVQMNRVVAGEVGSWEEVVPQLQALYSEAGFSAIAKFVSSCLQ